MAFNLAFQGQACQLVESQEMAVLGVELTSGALAPFPVLFSSSPGATSIVLQQGLCSMHRRMAWFGKHCPRLKGFSSSDVLNHLDSL